MSEAMCRARLDTIKMLFRRGGDIKLGQLLHHAVLGDSADVLELVGLLLDMGAPINEIQYENHPQSFRELSAFALGTPLHYAAEENNLELVSYLLKRGADPSIKNTKGRNVLQTAEFLQLPNVVEILQCQTLDGASSHLVLLKT
jgi:ankyrin repeat protein